MVEVENYLLDVFNSISETYIKPFCILDNVFSHLFILDSPWMIFWRNHSKLVTVDAFFTSIQLTSTFDLKSYATNLGVPSSGQIAKVKQMCIAKLSLNAKDGLVPCNGNDVGPEKRMLLSSLNTQKTFCSLLQSMLPTSSKKIKPVDAASEMKPGDVASAPPSSPSPSPGEEVSFSDESDHGGDSCN